MKAFLKSVQPLSMLSYDGKQRIELVCYSERTAHYTLNIYRNGEKTDSFDFPITSGTSTVHRMLPPPEYDVESVWELCDRNGAVCSQLPVFWKKPREWTVYVMVSSHTDIGLHNSQYIQRHNSAKFLDEAARLCDKTEDRPENDRYRYTMEGTWFWNNYPDDRGKVAAQRLVEKYIRSGKIGACCGVAGNVTQTFGFEEMCRATYGRRRLREEWGIETETVTMIDNNGLSWAMVQPFYEAGCRNLLFSPNHWNPLPSQTWECDTQVGGYIWNTEAGGGASRADVRYDSELPMLFWWQGADGKSRMLVWATNQYDHAGWAFGFTSCDPANLQTMQKMEARMAVQLPKLEAKVPFDFWLTVCYGDDQAPDCRMTDVFAMWNRKWKYPQFRTLGDPNVPFARVREQYAEQIPTLRGEIVGGWYQLAVSASDVLAEKLETDRRLANAETFASAAAMVDPAYQYPATAFSRAWEMLLWNDEHSYGCSGYQGRRVYETWIQHRDWVQKAKQTAEEEQRRALQAIARRIPGGRSVAIFNSTAQPRSERVQYCGGVAQVEEIPPFGYRTVPEECFVPESVQSRFCSEPPVVENGYYRIRFAANGAMCSIYDKQLKKELVSARYDCGVNAFCYTQDTNRTFHSPENAHFTVKESAGEITVVAEMDDPISGAAITQTVTLPVAGKRIEIDNRIEHLRDMVNHDRYHRFLYYAFPVAVENAKRVCQLNGCEAMYGKDLTEHGTDVYMAAHEWVCAENGTFGVGLIQLDTQLVEFDRIHPDKTDFGAVGDGSEIFSYVANDWLQMHLTGGSDNNLHLRYAITSYTGDHQSAGLAEMAERMANPVVAVPVTGDADEDLPAERMSFLQIPGQARLINVKRAEDGEGMIVRLYHTEPLTNVPEQNGLRAVRCAADEMPIVPEMAAETGFSTWRLGCEEIRVPVCAEKPNETSPIAPIGSVYTGLIDLPKAGCGEKEDQLYLLWGQNPTGGLSHYELYRSEQPEFVPSAENKVADVEPGDYRVARYEDLGLKHHTKYYYTVRAVGKDGRTGPFSAVFCGITRENP